MTQQRFVSSGELSTTEMKQVLGPEDTRRTLLLQNQHATANIYVANTANVVGAARIQIAPGGALLRDIFVPTSAIFAQADAAGVELTLVIGFD